MTSRFTRISELDVGLEDYTEEPQELLRRAVDSMTNIELRRRLENWTLRYFCEAYNRGRSEQFEWVESGAPPKEPDYKLYTQLGATPTPVEVTELLDPGRKRDDEYKLAWETARCTGDYLPGEFPPDPPADYDRQLIAGARTLLSKKYSKDYPAGTWLVVYFNPTLFTAFQEDTLVYAKRILSAALDSLPKPKLISQVWLLTNDLRVVKLSSNLAKYIV
jgi:hypothetical protein